jgi:hypothetical protein
MNNETISRNISADRFFQSFENLRKPSVKNG